MSIESALTPEEGKRLLGFAREAIVAAVENRPRPTLREEELPEGLRKLLGAFVTLYLRGELRGCIGRMSYDIPVVRNVAESAVSSALNDPRFDPVTREEVPHLRIEVSVLDPPLPIANIEQFDVDQHGIVMEHGFHHGVFLPKVAREYGWDRDKTLAMLCRKVGLPDDAWRDAEARFKVFHAIEFAEPTKE
jgi:AmmeMemoRadiSam system protein A